MATGFLSFQQMGFQQSSGIHAKMVTPVDIEAKDVTRRRNGFDACDDGVIQSMQAWILASAVQALWPLLAIGFVLVCRVIPGYPRNRKRSERRGKGGAFWGYE